MNRLRAWLFESKAFVVYIVLVAVVAVWLVSSNAAQDATAERQREIIATLAKQNSIAIAANGDFQTCVWLSIVKPKVIGHEKRAANAIHKCEHQYLEGR